MRTLVLLAITITVCLADTKGTPEDEKTIRKVIADGSAAWNRHDIQSEKTATDDFDIVVPPGMYMKAGPEMESRVKQDFEGLFKNAREIVVIERIRFIRPDVAIVDANFEITGTNLKPYAKVKGLQTMVLVKENNRWLVTAMRRMVPVSVPPLSER